MSKRERLGEINRETLCRQGGRGQTDPMGSGLRIRSHRQHWVIPCRVTDTKVHALLHGQTASGWFIQQAYGCLGRRVETQPSHNFLSGSTMNLYERGHKIAFQTSLIHPSLAQPLSPFQSTLSYEGAYSLLQIKAASG